MRFHAILRAVVCAAGFAAAAIQPAGASQILYEGINFFTGQASASDSFMVSGPGTLTVTVSDYNFPAFLSNLDLIMSTPEGLLGPEMMGPGTALFKIAAGGKVSAQVFATAQGALDSGMYGLNVQWSAVAPVPLPTSIALLLSGLILLVWQRRERGMGRHGELCAANS